MRWKFPLINPKRAFSINHFAEHVIGEVEEFQAENDLHCKALEALDVLHSAETLVRKFFQEHPELDVDALVEAVIKKNRDRGYYTD